MTRRTALLSVPALVGAVDTRTRKPAEKLVKPPRLHPGDTIGIISPSTQVTDPDRLQLAEKTIEYFELKPKWASSVRTHRAQGVATIDERVTDLHQMFSDPEVK